MNQSWRKHFAPKKPTARQAVGARSQYIGESFESWCNTQHREAVQQGILAWWRHVSPRVKWIGKGERAQAKIVGDAVADYVMQLCVSGRAVVAEAKATEKERLVRSAIEPQQFDHLEACVKHGGLGILLGQFTIDGLPWRYAAPWPVPWRERGQGASIGVEELQEWQVKSGENYLRRFIR